MAIGPILPGRIPNSLAGQQLLGSIQQINQNLTKLQRQISTNQQFFLPSDSPSAAIQTIGLQKLLERKTQTLTNITTDQSFLAATDSALSNVSNTLNTAKQLVLSGVGSIASPAERESLVTQADTLIRQMLNTANTQFRGRYLFGGSDSSQPPFTLQADNTVRYNGNQQSIQSLVDLNSVLSSNIDGHAAFGALSPPVGADLNPALTLNTKLSDLRGGQGIPLGPITVTLNNGGTPQTQTVDLTGAETVNDVKTRLEHAFSGGPLTLSVSIDPATKSKLVLTPSAGTVAVADVGSGLTAADLGIRGTAAASLTGTDLDPRLTLTTALSSLNGGAGIAATAGKGLLITNGSKTATVDVSGATTVEDLFNKLQQANIDINAQINSAGNGLAISSRLSGANFSIAENGDTTAADLGLRTFDGNTPLSGLNLGIGGQVDGGSPLNITRRDGTTVQVDLSGKRTVQDVLNAINAVDPGHLVASLKTVGNGIQLTDDSGSGPLTVDGNEPGRALGLSGTEPGNNPAVALVGKDVNPSAVNGVFDTLVRLRTALANSDNVELQRLDGIIDKQVTQVAEAQGEVGSREKALDDAQNRIQDQNVQLKDTLSKLFDTDVADAVTQLTNQQFTLQATYKIAGQALQMSLVAYL
jgi:flagellar hook-associated protein 3 FlgL